MCAIGNTRTVLGWFFEYHLRKATSATRPDVTIQYKNKDKIFLIGTACPCENSVDAKHAEKLKNTNNLHSRSERDE